MRLITFLFAFFACLFTVSALPSPLRPSERRVLSDTSNTKSISSTTRDVFVRHDDPLFARYFDDVYDISEREFLEATVEPRGGIATIAKAVIKGVIKIVELIKGKIAADKQKRSKWTSDMVAQFRQKYPHYNFVICHVKHKTNFKGVQGKDWGHSHHELKVSFGKTVGYEVYWFKEGTFKRLGDGGWLNWSYSGFVKSATQKNSFITFSKPP